MNRTTKRKQPRAEVHSNLVISVEGYEASASAMVNYHAYEPHYAFAQPDEEPVYEFSYDLVVRGEITSPKDRTGDPLVVTLHGGRSGVRDLDARLEDIAELDEHGFPRYRKYRGREVPIYRAPRGLGVLDKTRDEQEWRTNLFVKPSLVDRWLALLNSSRSQYISVHECKVGRRRWVRSIRLGTADPEEE